MCVKTTVFSSDQCLNQIGRQFIEFCICPVFHVVSSNDLLVCADDFRGQGTLRVFQVFEGGHESEHAAGDENEEQGDKPYEGSENSP